MTERHTTHTLCESADVVVLGAGPAGLVLGILLHAAGVQARPVGRDARGVVRTPGPRGCL
ncbi:FAD-dependent monooxygenase [Streptomyces virginiae]|uniref:FAD-dependent monooxygenase n=1 Tax=Streptomyces virginiae TaxID=1961 RepID=UPI0036602C9B